MTYQIFQPTHQEIEELAKELEVDEFDYDALADGGDQVDDQSIDATDVKVFPQIAYANLGGELIRVGSWTCHPRYNNILHWTEDRPLRARRMTWSYGVIAWRAGRGWPLYEVPCPRKRGFPKHKITIKFGNKVYAPCSVPVSATGEHQTQVFAYVDDDIYKDNKGYFRFLLHSYSTT